MTKNHLIHQLAVSGMRYQKNLPNSQSVYDHGNKLMSDRFKNLNVWTKTR